MDDEIRVHERVHDEILHSTDLSHYDEEDELTLGVWLLRVEQADEVEAVLWGLEFLKIAVLHNDIIEVQVIVADSDEVEDDIQGMVVLHNHDYEVHDDYDIQLL